MNRRVPTTTQQRETRKSKAFRASIALLSDPEVAALTDAEFRHFIETAVLGADRADELAGARSQLRLGDVR